MVHEKIGNEEKGNIGLSCGWENGADSVANEVPLGERSKLFGVFDCHFASPSPLLGIWFYGAWHQ